MAIFTLDKVVKGWRVLFSITTSKLGLTLPFILTPG
jgi:hypothetical protein